MSTPFTIISWNINGIRAVHKKGFMEWFSKEAPDVLCLQEIKAKEDQVPEEIRSAKGYFLTLNPAVRPGYSGVATFSKEEPLSVRKGFGIEEFDCEGRIIVTEFPRFYVLNVYFPRGDTWPESDRKRLTYKLAFYDAFLKFCEKLRKEKPIILSGDVNTAHQEIDLKNPKENVNNTGFMPAERAWIHKLIAHGYIDTFRFKHPDKIEYSWWTHRFNARARNIGWRIDYHFVSNELQENILDAFIETKVTGSDHAPVGLRLNLNL